MLHAAGYYMGDELLPPTPSNPKGYFEDRAVNDLNEDLLVQLLPLKPPGLWGRFYPWRLSYGHRWLAAVKLTATIGVTPEIEARMQSLTARRPFCFKDPRFCYTLDCWRAALGDAVFLCVFREPGRTASSMITDSRERLYLRDLRLSRARAVRVWTLMYRHVLEKHSRHGQWLFVHYDQILDGSAIARIEGLVEAEIDTGFVDRDLKRSAVSYDVPGDTMSIYNRLCDLAGFDEEQSSVRSAQRFDP